MAQATVGKYKRTDAARLKITFGKEKPDDVVWGHNFSHMKARVGS